MKTDIEDKIVVYQTYENASKAYIIKGLLDQYGIENFIGDENVAQLYPVFNTSLGGVRLYVFEKDIARIDQLIASQNLDPEE